MDPSSLIFVVIVAIWAVYLLGHWVRRRDMLATARSVDRFSEAMRVLERRVPQPVGAPRSRTYVVAPSRLPERVTTARVACEVDSGSARRAPGSVAAPGAPESAAPSAAASAEPAPASSGSTAAVSGGRPADPPAGRPASGQPSTGRLARRPLRRPDAAAKRARGLVLLGLLVLVPAGWLLTAWTSLPIWAPTVLTVALVGHVLRLRRIAMRRSQLERRRARAARATRGRAGAGRAERGTGSGRAAVTGSQQARVSGNRRAPQINRGRTQGSGPESPARSDSTDVGADRARSAATDVSGDRTRSASTDVGAHSARAADHVASVDVSDPSGSSGHHRDDRATARSALGRVGGRLAASDQVDGTAATLDQIGGSAAGPKPSELITLTSEQEPSAVATVETEADFTAPPGDGTAIAAAAGSGWQPVPVPPPTYTLKPKAPAPVQRPAPAGDRGSGRTGTSAASGPASPASAASEEAATDAGFDLDRILERRIAAGS